MRQLLFLIFTISCFSVASAQDNILVAEGTKPDLYLTHKVQPKENFYSVGRLYNLSPKEIAPYNHLDLAKGLSLGQVIRIPLTGNNYAEAATPSTTEAFVPVYHVAKGSKHILGYLKVSKELSPLANKSLKKAPTAEVAVKAPEKITPKPVAVKEKETAPIVTKEKEAVKSEEVVAVPVSKSTKSTIDYKGGVFKDLFDQQMKNKTESTETGISGVFKSTSGWQDGKYYCFNNSAPEGTIIKVTNSKTGKTIYAKVLDLIPDIKQNAGMILQLSNAAAEELQVTDTKFDCTISFYK